MRRVRRLLRSQHVREFYIGELDALEDAMTVVDMPAGTTFLHQGEQAATDPGSPCLFLIIEGTIDVRRVEDGRPPLEFELGPGALIGVLALFADGTRNASCTARTPATVATLSRPQFEQLLAARTVLALKFQKWVARQLAADLRRADEGVVRRARALAGERFPA